MRVIRRGLGHTLRGISDFGGDMAGGGKSGLPLAGLLARYEPALLGSGALSSGLIYPSAGDRSRPPQPGRCGHFDGLDDYIATGVNPYSAFPNGGTIEFWFNADTIAAGTNRIFTIGTSGGGTRIAAALVGDQVQMLGSGGALLHTTTALTGVWYHVAIVTNFNNSHHFYVNGVLIGTATTVWSFADADTFRVAADTQVVVGRHYDGKLSHFRFWGGQLTGEQVRDLYLNGPKNSLSRDSLELEYLLENQHSTFVFDSSGAERHGSKIGVDASVGQFHHEGSSVPFSGENESGYTQLAWFDGVDDRIVISNNAVTDGFFPMEDYTLEIEAVRDNFNFNPFFHLSDPDNLNKYIQFRFPINLAVTFAAGMAEHTTTTLMAPYTAAGVAIGQLFTAKAVIRQGFQGLYINDVLMASKDLTGTFVFNDSMLTLGFGQTTGASTAYARSLVKSVKLTDNLTGEVKLHLDFSTLKDGKSIVDSSTGKVYAIEGADSRFMQRIPAATATTDASGGTLTYTGEVAKPAKYKQSWCGNFDGLDDYIQFNNFVDASLLEQGRATVRIKTDGGGYTTIFGFGNTDNSIVAGLDNGMVWLLALQNQYNDFIYKETPAIISNGVEYLIEVSWGNGNYSIKVDGVLQPLVDWSSETISGDSVVLANNTPLVIGADTFDAGSLPFDGHIFDLQIYDKNGNLFSHVPICEGAGSPVAHDVVRETIGTIIGADVSVGGTFWGKQDSYHYNVSNGWSWDYTETFRIPYLASGVPNSTSPYYKGDLADIYFSAVEAAGGSFDLASIGGNDSDFSAGVNGWTGTVGGVIAGNIDGIGGQNDSLRYTIDSSTGNHRTAVPVLALGETYEITFDYYIPSSNTVIDRVEVNIGGSVPTESDLATTAPTNVWTSARVVGTASSTNEFRLLLSDNSGSPNRQSFTGNGTDVAYIRNVRIRNVRYTTYTEPHVKQAHIDLFAGLKADGVWDKISELYLFTGKTFGGLTAKAKGSGAIVNNGFSPGDYLAAGSVAGLTGDGSSYLTLGNPSSSLGSYFAVITDPPSANGSYLGVKGFPSTDRIRFGYDLVADLDYANIGGSNTDRVTGGAPEARIVVVSRQSATSLKFFDNGVQIAEATNNIIYTDSDPFPLLGFAEYGSSDLPSNFSDATIAALGYGETLTNTEAANLTKRLNFFMWQLGAETHLDQGIIDAMNLHPDVATYASNVLSAGGNWNAT